MNTEVASAPVEGFCAPQFTPVREAFEQNLASLDLGASVSVWANGEQVVNLWGGWREEAKLHRWSEDTLVLVASCTKAFTATCLLQLIEAGEVDLDAPVATYWPEFANAGKGAITVRDILTHQGGLAGITADYSYDDYFAWEPVIRLLEQQAPLWSPRTRHGYHPVLFGHLVGEIVRRVSGLSLGRYLAKHVCAPLGLDFHVGLDPGEFFRTANVSFAAPELIEPTPEFKALIQRSADPESITRHAFGNPPAPADVANSAGLRGAEMPGSNGHGTAAAVARFYAALANGGELDDVRILRPETVAMASSEQVFGVDATIGVMSRFGLGFMLRHDLFPIGPHAEAFGHPGAGGNLGFADPIENIGFGYVMNRGKPSMFGSPTAYNLVNALYGCL